MNPLYTANLEDSVAAYSEEIFAELLYSFGYKIGFPPLSRMTTNNQSSPWKFCSNTIFTLLKQSQRSRSSYKMDLGFWDYKPDLDFGVVLDGKHSVLQQNKYGRNYKHFRVVLM